MPNIEMTHDLSFQAYLMRRLVQQINRAYQMACSNTKKTVDKNVIALNMLVIANQTYNDLNRFIHDKNLEHRDTIRFFNHCEFMLDNFCDSLIKQELDNHLLKIWMSNLAEYWTEAEKILENSIENLS